MIKVGFWAAAVLAAGVLLSAPPARADLISIGLQEARVNGGHITTIGSGSRTSGGLALTYGSFAIDAALAQDTLGAGGLPELLYSASLNASAHSAGTLNVWITAQGLTGPAGFALVKSAFSASPLIGDVASVTERTFYDAADGRYAITTPLASEKFVAAGSRQNSTGLNLTGGPFSITEEYTIVMQGAGLAYDTINTSYASVASVTSVPEPTSLALLVTGVGGLGWIRRRRRTRT